jgi:hypothetical protein
MPNHYYINRNDKVRGPFTEERIRELYAEGKLREADLLSTRSDGGWKPVASVLSLGPTPQGRRPQRFQPATPVKPATSRKWPLIIGSVCVVAMFVAGMAIVQWNRESYLPKSSKQDSETVLSEPVLQRQPEVAPALIQQARPYNPGDSFTVIRDAERADVAPKSIQQEGRLISYLLDCMTKYLEFDVNMNFTASEDCGLNLPAESLQFVITAPNRKAFEKWQPVVVDCNDKNARDLLFSLVRVYVRMTRCAHNEDSNPATLATKLSSMGLQESTEIRFAKMSQCYEQQEFDVVGEFEKFTISQTTFHSRNFGVRADQDRTEVSAGFMGDHASYVVLDISLLNELVLMKDKADVTFDLTIIADVFRMIANPKLALNGSVSGSDVITPIATPQ